MQGVVLCAPSRIYFDHPGGRFSYSSMVDYFHRVGIGAIDMSFESLSRLDPESRAVLYATATRAKEKGIIIPLCHLSFYMPDHSDAALMEKYQKVLFEGVDAAAIMGIPLAVAHPIALYSSESSYGDWIRANLAFLMPLVEYAKGKGVRILIENMASEREADGDHLYGSCALNISSLADKLGVGVCWDVGHAHISGLCQSEQILKLGDRLEVIHAHDNFGERDLHLLPFDGDVDWDDVALGICKSGFSGILDIEVTAWALEGTASVRENFGRRIVMRARQLMALAELI
ncbi:MAG: sugar phosphate isomerase/epimerase [Clostridia bacterium]|nr:sugar phosphate isomerase/epimerase [Clostridia bacterium]